MKQQPLGQSLQCPEKKKRGFSQDQPWSTVKGPAEQQQRADGNRAQVQGVSKPSTLHSPTQFFPGPLGLRDAPHPALQQPVTVCTMQLLK
jgi:hypothetical protein